MTSSSMKDFQIMQKLGSGSFSVVYKVKRVQDQQVYAFKKVTLPQLKEKEKQNALNEVRLLASLNNNYVVAYKDAFIDESTASLCIVMELLSGGDLQKRIGSALKGSVPPFTEIEIWRALVHMTKGLKALHDVKVVHRDLKAANVFITQDGIFKLGDLNVSKVAKQGLVYTQTGTPYYASPEVWRDEPYDTKSDMWSLGCVLYEMAALKPPFRAQDMQGLNRKVQQGKYDPLPSRYSKDLSDLIGLLIKVKPSLRPSCDQILTHELVSKFISENEKVEVDEKAMLLQTIQLTKNVKALKGFLPKSKYNEPARDNSLINNLSVIPNNDRHYTSERVQSASKSYLIKKLLDVQSRTPERKSVKIEQAAANYAHQSKSNQSVTPERVENKPPEKSQISNNSRVIEIKSQRPIVIQRPYSQQPYYNQPDRQIKPQSQRYHQPGSYSQLHGPNEVQQTSILTKPIEVSNSRVIQKDNKVSLSQNNRQSQNNPIDVRRSHVVTQGDVRSTELRNSEVRLSQQHDLKSAQRKDVYKAVEPQNNPKLYPQRDQPLSAYNQQHQSQSIQLKSEKVDSAIPKHKDIIQNVFPIQARVQPKRANNESNVYQQNPAGKATRPLSSNIIPDHQIQARQRMMLDYKNQFNIITNVPYHHYYPVEHYQLRNQLSDPTLIKPNQQQLYYTLRFLSRLVAKPQYKLSEVQKYQKNYY